MKSVAVALALLMVGFPALLADAQQGSAAVAYDEVASEVGLAFSLAGEMDADEGFFDPWPAFYEIMGSGACWLDFDGDGYEDLYLVNQRYNDQNPNAVGFNDRFDPRNALYRNVGDGSFEDVSAGSGADSNRFGYACTAADFDGDGDLDLFVANLGDNQLLRNDGGRFTDVSASSHINPSGGCGAYLCMSITSAWADYDGDGDLDLFVGNYVDSTWTDTRRGPEEHYGQLNFLLRNDDGVFSDVAEAAGVQGRHENGSRGSKTLGSIWMDADLDGDPDLYVANDYSVNEFYVNRGDGTFEDASDWAGLADEGTSMGVASGDYDQDGYPDLYFTHYSWQEHGFYRNLGNLQFERRSGEDGLANVEELVGWGTAFVDLERDGDLDIVAAFGHTEPWYEGFEQPTRFYYNDPGDGSPGDRLWVDRSSHSGPGAQALGSTRGAAFADYDLDGDTDIVLVNNGNATVQFLRAGGHPNHWLSLLLRQSGPNVHAVGARVVLEANGVAQTLEVQAGSSYSSQNSQRLDFGLGDAATADRIKVHWPDGGISEYRDVAAGRVLRLDRTLGIVEDTLAPHTTLLLNGVPSSQLAWSSAPSVVLDTRDRNVGAPASGVDRVEFRLDDGPWQVYHGQTIHLDGAGRHEIGVRSMDRAGNQEPARTLEFFVDSTPPRVSHALTGPAGEANWWRGPVQVSMQASDDLSGVAQRVYRVDGGPWLPYNGAFDVSGDGVHEVQLGAGDRAGNRIEATPFTLAIDESSPNARIDRPASKTAYAGGMEVPSRGNDRALLVSFGPPVDSGVFEVVASASDALSGMDRLEFRVDGVLRHTDTEAPFTWDWPAAQEAPGEHRLRVDAFDAAGNSQVRALTVVVASDV